MDEEDFYEEMRVIVYNIIESSTAKALSGGFVDIDPNKIYFGPGAGKLTPAPNAGGINDDWAGSLPKFLEVLPEGTWFAGSQKRSRKNTQGGSTSDHYAGKDDSYAGDFGLGTAFKGNKELATAFAIAIANKAGKPIKSWRPYVGSYLNINTPDGYRVQIIWQSLVGGNHYDHVHVGIRKL